MNLLAQREYQFGNPVQGIGPLGIFNNAQGSSQAPTLLNNFISGAIGVMSAIAGIWFIFLFITGAVGIISSGGDKASFENARQKITTGLIGIVVVIAAIFIVDVIGRILGIDLILDPGKFVETFTFN